MTVSQTQTFDPFAKERAYVEVNDRVVGRLFRRLKDRRRVRLLDVAAGTGLLTGLAVAHSQRAGIDLQPTLLDFDRSALLQAREEVHCPAAQFVYGSAYSLPFEEAFDAVIFANALHLLDEDAKSSALQEVRRVLRPRGLFVVNTTFYEGAYPDESKPFYSRWIRRAISEINKRLPSRSKGERAQAMEWLPAEGYRELLECHGFRVVEQRERRVLLPQSAVRAISSYKEFAKGALHATDEDAEEASRALQTTVRQTFQDLQMKYLPRNWAEFIAVKA